MKTVMELQNKLTAKQTELVDVRAELAVKQAEESSFEIDRDIAENDLRVAIDEESVTVCGLTFNPSRIIEELDPTAWRCMINDHSDSMDNSCDPEYVTLTEEIEELETQESDLESEIEDLEEQIEELEESEL